MLIFYRRFDRNSPCEGPISLGEFLKRTLSWEIKEGENAWNENALKANAIAARTFTISSYKSDVYVHTNGQSYHCTNAWEQEGFEERRTDDLNTLAAQYPRIFQAIQSTVGIVMTHPEAANREINVEAWPSSMRFGAIEASYKRETGWFTAEGGRPWLKEVFDPISSGSPDVGMGQLGSKRWAQGSNDSGQAFPKWDYRRILAHYYSEVDFVGITPDPPNSNRGNIAEVEGIPPNGGLILCKGEKLKDIHIRFQNVGNSLPVNHADLPGFCSGVTNPQTLIGYHLYKQDGSSEVSSRFIGLRSTPLCYPDGAIPPGRDHVSTGFEIFIPDDPAILKGSTYLLRFDLMRNGVWQGRTTSFAWPPQDIPVTICTSGGGSGSPEVSINRPPAVVSYNSLVSGRYGFSWSGRNVTRYDLQYRSKQVWEAAYPNNWEAPAHFQDMDATVTQFSFPMDCNYDHRVAVAR